MRRREFRKREGGAAEVTVGLDLKGGKGKKKEDQFCREKGFQESQENRKRFFGGGLRG